MLYILAGDEHIGEIYNIGNPHNTITMTQLAEEVVATIGSDSRIVHRDYKEDFSKLHG